MATINLQEDTDIMTSTLTFEDRVNVDELKLSEVPNSNTTVIGDILNYKDSDGTTIFSGIVQGIKTGSSKEIAVWDYGAELLQRNVNHIFIGYSPEAIIEYVITNYTSLTFVSTVASGVIIGNYKANNKRAWDIVQEMCDILIANFRTDMAKNFYLEIYAETLSTKTINTTNAVLDGSWEENKENLINSVTVEAQPQVFQKTITFSGDGTSTQFTLPEIPIDVQVLVGGVEQVGYVPDVSTGDYYVTKNKKQLTFDTAPASGTDNVQVIFTFNVPINPKRQNSESIEKYGQHDKVFRVPYITSRSEARDFATYIINKFKDPLLSSTWIITSSTEYADYANYVPNQLINVTDSIRGISGQFLIKKVVRKSDGTLRITVGDDDSTIFNWQKEVQVRVKQLEEKDDNSNVINEDVSVEDTVTITLNTSITEWQSRSLSDAFFMSRTSLANAEMSRTDNGIVMYRKANWPVWVDI